MNLKLPDIETFVRPIKLQSKVEMKDSFGTPQVTYVDFHQGYASITPVSNQELFATERQTSFSQFSIQMHYKAGITQNMILLTLDTLEYFDVKSVFIIGRNQFIELTVDKIVK
jgi:head-tail adaptor